MDTIEFSSLSRFRFAKSVEGLREVLLKEELGQYEIGSIERMPLPTRVADGDFDFHPVAHLDEDDNLIITNLVRNMCWGFCGANQNPGKRLLCDFTPYSAEVAQECEESFQDGLEAWTITASNGSKYRINKREDNTFTQTNLANRSLVRRVLRIHIDVATKLVVRTALKEAAGDKVALLLPLLDSKVWDNTPFPVEEYDELLTHGFPNPEYQILLEQVQLDVPTIDSPLTSDTAYKILFEIGGPSNFYETKSVRIVF